MQFLYFPTRGTEIEIFDRYHAVLISNSSTGGKYKSLLYESIFSGETHESHNKAYRLAIREKKGERSCTQDSSLNNLCKGQLDP